MARPIVLCVRNEPADSLGVAPRLLREAGCEVVVSDAFEHDPPSPAGDGRLAGLVVFGGEMNADQLDRYTYLRRVREMMRHAVDRAIPTLGICLGAQILARAFGARVYRAPVRELGFVPIVPSPAALDDPLLSQVRPGDHFFEWHEDTFDLPAGATLLATGNAVHHQAFRIGSGWGIQFHPEVDAEEITRWLADAGPGLESAWGRAADQVMADVGRHLADQTSRAQGLFQAFARIAAARSLSPEP